MTIVLPGGQVQAPEPVGPPETLLARLLAQAAGTGVALGLDCPIGLPRGFAGLHLAEPDFPAFLRALPDASSFWDVAASLAEVSAARPFYPARGLRGMTRLAHAQALGLPDQAGLGRLCDRATAERPAGAPVLWTLGANQSGKAAISAWRALIGPALRASPPARLWPFDGPFRSLVCPGRVAIAEAYPAEAMRHLGVVLRGSKRRQADRAACAGALFEAVGRLGAGATLALQAAVQDGFGPGAAGEDMFDSLLGALCVLGVMRGLRPDFAPDDPAILAWEGWVLGQTALPPLTPC